MVEASIKSKRPFTKNGGHFFAHPIIIRKRVRTSACTRNFCEYISFKIVLSLDLGITPTKTAKSFDSIWFCFTP